MPKSSCETRSTSKTSPSCPNRFQSPSLPKLRGERWALNKLFALSPTRSIRSGAMGARSILIVEDEPLIAMMLEDFLDSLGHKVRGTCDTVKCALDEVEKGGFDLAILDVNLKGENVWPVATRLREKKVPFVIAAGGHVDPPPPEFDDAPIIEKPYTVDRVTPAIEAAFAA